MANQGDDCYFYFYSTCTKGNECAFRHCEAALGSETVCTLWLEGRCTRPICKFRHSKIDKKRSEIPCYWETQPTGCQKINCAFHHSKPRFVDGVYLPPSKNLCFVNPPKDVPSLRPKPAHFVATDVLPVKEGIEEEKKGPPATAQPVLSNPSAQLRNYVKMESTESVPSPTHPPVVITTEDDDDEDDDKTFEEVQPKTVKEGNSSGPLQFSQSKGGSVIQKEDLRTVVRTVTFQAKQALENNIEVPVKRSLAERLGKKIDPLEGGIEEGQFKGQGVKRVQERLGLSPKKVDKGDTVTKTIKERLSLPTGSTAISAISQTTSAGEIRIKTLEEIRREKAARKQAEILMQIKNETLDKQGCINESSSKCISRENVDSSQRFKNSFSGLQTFSKLLKERKQKRMEMQRQKMSLSTQNIEMKDKEDAACSQECQTKELRFPAGLTGRFLKQTKPFDQVRVKTLEEIRQEKALRGQHIVSQGSDSTVQTEPATAKRKRIRLVKLVPVADSKRQNCPDTSDNGTVTESSLTMPECAKEIPGEKVQVKSFEDIMREKQLRRLQEAKQQQHENLQEVPAELPVVQKREPPVAVKKELLAQVPPQVQQAVEKPAETKSPLRPSLVQKTSEIPGIDQLSVQSLQNTEDVASVSNDSKLTSEKRKRPKVNVKPSVVNTVPALTLDRKRKQPASQPSAIATVKPLKSNRIDNMEEDPSSQTTAHSAPSSVFEVLSTEASEALQESIQPSVQNQPVVPSPTEAVSPTSSRTSAKMHRLSSVSSSKQSAGIDDDDDFEALIQEFSNDSLEVEIELEPGKDEDDLLLELSEMIES